MEGFIRIPKTASTSLQYSLQNVSNIEVLEHGYCFEPKNVKGYWWNNGNLTFNKSKYTKLYTVVRNPFDLLVSYYFHNDGATGWGNCSEIHGFNNWVEFITAYIDPNFEWHIPRMKQSLFSFAYDEDWNFIPLKYFKYENLSELNDFIISKGGKELVITNKTNKPLHHYREYYDKEWVEKLNIIWKNDLQYFNYSF